MNCIIVEDDANSRKLIEEFVNKTEKLELLKSFSGAIEAINFINHSKEEVDLVLLDVELPEMTGIELLRSLNQYPQIIIISAKEKYAVEAFEYDVTDYLLKPISYGRFYKAVSRVFNRYNDSISYLDNEEIFIKKNSSLVRLRYDDILWVEALENYVIVSTFDEKYTIHFTMKCIQRKLPSKKFKRVHRSYIVNINRIQVIEDNAIVISVRDETKVIPIGKSYKDKLMDELNLMQK